MSAGTPRVFTSFGLFSPFSFSVLGLGFPNHLVNTDSVPISMSIFLLLIPQVDGRFLGLESRAGKGSSV